MLNIIDDAKTFLKLDLLYYLLYIIDFMKCMKNTYDIWIYNTTLQHFTYYNIYICILLFLSKRNSQFCMLKLVYILNDSLRKMIKMNKMS